MDVNRNLRDYYKAIDLIRRVKELSELDPENYVAQCAVNRALQIERYVRYFGLATDEQLKELESMIHD